MNQAKHIGRRRLSACLALAVVLSMALGAAVPAMATGTPEVTVTLLCQADNTGFLIAPQDIAVQADLSERYGYDDTFGGTQASILDVLVAAHVLVYGTEKSVINENFAFAFGGITVMMGITTYNAGYFKNGSTTDTADTVPITDGDAISVYVYQDDWGMDILAWFEAEGEPVTALSAEAGASIELELRGIVAAGWGEWNSGEHAIDHAAIVPVTRSGAGAAFGAPIAATDDDGMVTLTFGTPGTFVFSAIDAGNGWELPLLSPWLVVTVAPSPAQLLAEAKAEKIAAINAVTNGLTEADYTPESWAALQAAIAQAIASVNAATSIDSVNAVRLPSREMLSMTCLQQWETKLPGWLSGIPALPDWFEWVIMVVFFGWIWWLF